jgi:hypothetical protein
MSDRYAPKPPKIGSKWYKNGWVAPREEIVDRVEPGAWSGEPVVIFKSGLSVHLDDLRSTYFQRGRNEY